MAFRHGHVGTTEGFGEVGTVDKTQGNNTGHHRVDINLSHAHRVRYAVQRNLQTVKDKQHQHQIGNAANKRGVAFKYERQRFVSRKLRPCARQTYQHRQHHGADSQLKGDKRAL